MDPNRSHFDHQRFFIHGVSSVRGRSQTTFTRGGGGGVVQKCLLFVNVHKVENGNRGVRWSKKAKMLKFIYSEKATKFCEIVTLLLTGTT